MIEFLIVFVIWYGGAYLLYRYDKKKYYKSDDYERTKMSYQKWMEYNYFKGW